MIKKFNQLNVASIDLNKVQTNIANSLRELQINPILDFNIVKDVSLVTGDNVVDHKLGRSPAGWILTRKNALADIYDKQNSNQTPNLNYILTSSANVTVDLYFF
jgi:hypothetical protein